MSKNFFSLRTGHKASDEYFKYAPIYCDSDLIKHCAVWFVVGFLFGLLADFLLDKSTLFLYTM